MSSSSLTKEAVCQAASFYGSSLLKNDHELKVKEPCTHPVTSLLWELHVSQALPFKNMPICSLQSQLSRRLNPPSICPSTHVHVGSLISSLPLLPCEEVSLKLALMCYTSKVVQDTQLHHS